MTAHIHRTIKDLERFRDDLEREKDRIEARQADRMRINHKALRRKCELADRVIDVEEAIGTLEYYLERPTV